MPSTMLRSSFTGHRAGPHRLRDRATVDPRHGEAIVEEHEVEAALFERPGQLLVVARGEESVLRGRMPPGPGVDGGVPRLHEPDQGHLPFLVRHGALPYEIRHWPNLVCNISDIKLISTTVRAQAADELRDRILTGRLRPGDRLDLDQLTAEFGISRTPIREALLELSYEGLVAITPRSGMAVVGITPEDAVDNFAILAALAGKGAELATARISSEELHELRALAGAIGGSDDVVAANRYFHRAINLAVRARRGS